ncbi:MAG: anti-sigma factor antagonist [Clostridia bacterium]|nr:anti-sigma factor antagonist [Clostridia bacterium]
MRGTLENGKLTLALEGRIDSTNAAAFEKEIMQTVAANPGATIELDVEKLEYISSAGLRVLMKLRKRAGKALVVLNVSPEVYEIFDMTGFTELLDVKKRLREVSVEGCRKLGEGANGTVYRLTRDEIIKVFRPDITLEAIEGEREAARRAFLLGVPCAIAFDTVRVCDSYGTVYEMLDAATVAERVQANPERLDELAVACAKLLKELHETEVPEGQLPTSDTFTHRAIDKVAEEFTPEEVARMHALYDSIPAMNRFIHNDYHPKNVMETNGELMLIDLGDASAGNPVIDLIHSYMVFKLIGSGQKEHADDEMSFVDMTYGHLRRFWKVFSETYCGSAEKAARLDAKLEPYAQMMYLTASMAHPLLPRNTTRLMWTKCADWCCRGMMKYWEA